MATWDARANELFLSALEYPPADRAAFLDAACADDAVLRARVESLLNAEVPARDFLARPAVAPAVADERSGSDRLGPYKLLQKIGEGGMGTVWMAEQIEPVRRTVAVKVTRGSPDSAHMAARFEAERQALALMDHPNIATVLDAGTTPDGRLFFVMELVKGIPITTFCDDRRLTLAERLGLFVQVCRAVQHAHQKGVIHRDLKPSNILVALYDGRPVPKVIDFGVAKATGQRLTDKTLFTEFGTVIGTLEYMSPEQAELNQLDVDTRTDVYSLGVLLYELLTGTTPLDRQRLGSAPLLEVLRQVREGDTPRPSTRLSTAATLPTIAAARGIDPRHLAGLLKGELDWITLTALEKDRERRYESAAALAADVERYLRDDPVQACPPTVWYRVRKFARRHRRGLFAAAAVGLTMFVALGGVAGAVGWAVRDAESRRAKELDDARASAAAELNKADLLVNERKRAEAEAAWERAARHLSGAPDDALADRLADTRQRLDAAARDDAFVAGYEALLAELDPRSDDQSPSALVILEPDGNRERELLTRYGMGTDTDPAAAAALFRSRPAEVRWYLTAALYRCAAHAGSQRPSDPRVTAWFAKVLDAIDPDPWRVALRATFAGTDAAAIEKLVREVDPKHQHPVVLLVAVGRAYRTTPRHAIELLTRAQAAHPNDAWLNSILGLLLGKLKSPGKAIPYLTAAIALRPNNPTLLLARAQACRETGQMDAALRDVAAALEAAPRHVLGHCYHSTLLVARGDAVGGEAAARKALAISPNSPVAHQALGDARRVAKDAPGALAAYRAAVAADPKYAEGHTAIGVALLGQRDVAGAITAFNTAAACDPRHTKSRDSLGVTLWRYKTDYAGAEAAFREVLAIDPAHSEGRTHLVRVLLAAAKPEAALSEANKAVAIKPQSAVAHEDLGAALAAAGKDEEAIEALRRSVCYDSQRASSHCDLGTMLSRRKEFRNAVVYLSRATELDPSLVEAWTNLGLTLLELKEFDKAVAACKKGIACDQKQARSHYLLGMVLGGKGDNEGAAAAFRAAADLNAKYPGAWLNAGAAAQNLGRWREARDAWAKAVGAVPDDRSAHYRLGVVSAIGPDPELFDHQVAEKSGKQLIALGLPGTGWMLVAWAEYRKGDWKAAIAAIEKVLPPGAPANQVTPLRGYLLALAHAKLGNTDEARRWYDKAVAAKPDSIPEAVARARAEAAELLGIDPPKK